MDTMSDGTLIVIGDTLEKFEKDIPINVALVAGCQPAGNTETLTRETSGTTVLKAGAKINVGITDWLGVEVSGEIEKSKTVTIQKTFTVTGSTDTMYKKIYYQRKIRIKDTLHAAFYNPPDPDTGGGMQLVNTQQLDQPWGSRTIRAYRVLKFSYVLCKKPCSCENTAGDD
jgi:hypothetical protein